jgi:general secretion pathway protein L
MIQIPNMRSDAVDRGLDLSSAFFGWWINELLGTIPASYRRRFSRRGELTIVRLEGEAIQLQNAASGPERWNVLEDPTEVSSASSFAAALLLPSRLVLRRVIELPSAAAASLQETTSFQINRLTPFMPNDVYHLARLVRRDRRRKAIRVELAVVPRRAVQDSLSTLARYHIEPQAIIVDGDMSEPALDFFSVCMPRKRPASGFGGRALMAVSVLLLLATPFVMAYRVHLLAGRVQTQAAAATVLARKTMAAQTQLDDLVQSERFLPSRLQRPQAIETLDELSRLIPDTSWIFRLEFRGEEIAMSGFSADLPALLQDLAKPPFAMPELTSPVVQGLTTGQTRFDLRLRYRSGT